MARPAEQVEAVRTAREHVRAAYWEADHALSALRAAGVDDVEVHALETAMTALRRAITEVVA